MDRRDNQVPSFGSLQAGVRGFSIANLANHDDVGILAKRSSQSISERAGVRTDLALDDHAFARLKEELDRILNGDHVRVPGFVDVANYRRDACRFSITGRPGDQNQPTSGIGNLRENRGQVELLETADVKRN